jgi:hypothetical protein
LAAIALLDVEGAYLAVLEDAAAAHGDDFALRGLLLGGIGDNDAALGLLLFFHALDQDAVVKWSNSHVISSI